MTSFEYRVHTFFARLAVKRMRFAYSSYYKQNKPMPHGRIFVNHVVMVREAAAYMKYLLKKVL